MKIGLNGQRILTQNPAGPELYTINLFKSLAKIDSENDYLVYLDREPDKDFFEELRAGNTKFNYKVVSCERMWTQYGLAREIIKNPVDVFFTAVHTIPMIKSSRTKFVAMIHGLEYRYSKNYKNPINRFKIERPIKYAVKNSDKIIAPSQATKDEILKRDWGVSEENIDVVYEGVSDFFYKRDENEIEKVREKYEIGNDFYLFFISTIQPRKNLPNLIRAFSQFLRENPEHKNTKLLVAGKKGWDCEESLEAPIKYGIEENVKFLGRVPTEDLPGLFSGSRGYTNVSFEEGFGLPLLESMACGVPSVVSDIPAHREVGGNLPIYADPNNIENIKDGIFEIMNNTYNPNDFIERSKLFSWEKTAQYTLDVLKKAIEKI
ncbi:glycosyltransferase family 4 protein [Patescibacteria group bacterium]|nr:glycosyltransferase family 4 protein [Patescibacteria group bacterium]